MKKKMILTSAVALTLISPIALHANKQIIETEYSNYTYSTAPATINNPNGDGLYYYIIPNKGVTMHEGEQIVKTTYNKTDSSCGLVQTYSKTSDQVDWEAAAVIDTRLDMYSNNGYFAKVLNKHNHPDTTNPVPATVGAGNLEMQHYVVGSKHVYRPVIATDYAIDNATITITLPTTATTTNVTVSSATDWVVDRYYPAVANGGTNYYTTKLDLLPTLVQNGNIITITLPTMSAGSAGGLEIGINYGTNANAMSTISQANIKVEGTFNHDGLVVAKEAQVQEMKANGASEEEIANATLLQRTSVDKEVLVKEEALVCEDSLPAGVKVKYVSEDGTALPEAVNLVKAKTKFHFTQTNGVITEMIDDGFEPETTVVEVEGGKWEYVNYNFISANQDNEYIGMWKFIAFTPTTPTTPTTPVVPVTPVAVTQPTATVKKNVDTSDVSILYPVSMMVAASGLIVLNNKKRSKK